MTPGVEGTGHSRLQCSGCLRACNGSPAMLGQAHSSLSISTSCCLRWHVALRRALQDYVLVVSLLCLHP